MLLEEWIDAQHRIFMDAAENLPPEYVEQLRIFQNKLLVQGLESGFLKIVDDDAYTLRGHFTEYEMTIPKNQIAP